MTKITTRIESLHAARGKHWAKMVTRIDPSRTNGYAFVGEWVRMDQAIEVPAGAVILAVDEDTSANGRFRGRTIRVLSVTERGIAELANEYTKDGGWALLIRPTIESVLPDAGERVFRLIVTEKQRDLLLRALEAMYAADPLTERESEDARSALRAAEEIQ